MTQPFNIAMTIRADAGQAKGTIEDFRKSLQQTSTEAGKVKSALEAEAAALDRVVAGASKAAAAKRGLTAVDSAAASSALTRAIQQTAGTARLSIDATATAAQAARAPLEGFASAITASSAAISQTAIASNAYKIALDDIRASYNPLFAASRQYEQSLERIADHERMGAISAREAAAARQRAAAQLGPTGQVGARSGAPGSWITGNLAAQGNDIMMMAAAGQNPLMLALQQGTQVSQVLNSLEKGTSITGALAAGFASMLNPVSLVTIGLIALGTFGLQALTGLIPKAKSFDDALGELSGAVGDYGKHLKIARASTGDLAAEFGTAAGAAQGLARAMADIDRRRAMRGASDTVNALQKDAGLWLVDPSWRNDNPNADTNAQLFDARRAKDRRKMRSMFGLDASAASSALIDPVLDAMTGFDQAKTAKEQVAAVEQLKTAWQVAAEARSGISKAEDDFLAKLIATGQEIAKLQALDENAAGVQSAKDMARDLERQAATQIAIAKYGQDSAAVRQLELIQQREITAAKLEDLGIAKDSAEWLQVMAGLQVRHEAGERTIREERARAHGDEIAALDRQRRLVGATTAEQLRANAVAEAELEIRNRMLSPLQAALEINRAIARASAEAAIERQRAIHDLQTTVMTDALDAQIGMARDPLSRADLEGERERVRLIREGADADIAAARAAAVRARSLTEAINQSRGQIATISDEVSVRQQVAAQVAAGTVAATDANRLIQQELQLRPLIAAAARAEGDEKRRLTEIVTGLRVAHELQAAEERRQAQNDYLRGSAERIQQARLELALVGQTAAVRARVLALVQAERDIRAQGLTGDAAAGVRRQAGELVGLNEQIEAQADAWKRVQGAGESAIDAVLDKLKGGDIRGAFAGLLDELNKGFFELGVANPLKNMLLGTNLGTLDDIGGLSGIWDRLTGKTTLDQSAVIGAATTPVQAMQIAASQVTINAATLGLGGGVAGLLAGLPGAGGIAGAANINALPTAASSEVQALLSGVAAGGGTRAGAIANLDAALADPLAAMVAEAQRLFGVSAIKINSAYRSTERQAPLWQDALQKYGSAEAARKWVAPPGRSNHNHGLAADLGYGSPEVQRWFHQNAASYGLTYRMANEPWHIEPMGGRGAARGRLGQDTAAAQQAIAALGTSAQTAALPISAMGQTAQTTTAQVGDMGAGMGEFGGALQQILGAAVSGNKGGAVGGLINIGLGWLTKGMGFSAGGPTGGSDPSRVAGVVHEQEYVFSAAAVRRIGAGNLDALHKGTLRGFARGGYVGPGPMQAAPGAGNSTAVNNVTFAPSFDLRGANDPAEVERAARRGMQAALEDYDRTLPRRFREIGADQRAI